MTRVVVLLAGMLVAGFTGLFGATPAGAWPAPGPVCTYTLSNPEVVQVDGAATVQVTVAPTDCGWPASPRQHVACLQVTGDPVTHCVPAQGGDIAVVRVPYRQGAVYTGTGRGCGGFAGFREPSPNCQPLGPSTATL
ncbi:hypothetical protein [Mycolicibacterium fallax]|uniref:Uncharacterized protein n=1 Tax=Mycolicibacterium fallax TaxID=1793 RepID=A0A1X1RDI0_MYCFA|nr:hypothetical protein [Mycolicibacterium fallax]ORV03515.1 hypothetical protein AWC04_10440 [Mycolicibacterium fallax]BBY97431.1 hypothetical protein MFAL_08980 [Mycolicibacterium fallax]